MQTLEQLAIEFIAKGAPELTAAMADVHQQTMELQKSLDVVASGSLDKFAYFSAKAKILQRELALEIDSVETATKMQIARAGGYDEWIRKTERLKHEEEQLSKVLEARRRMMFGPGLLNQAASGAGGLISLAGVNLMGLANKATLQLTASTLGFVTAGVRASVSGQLLGFSMERLYRTMAGLFRPEVMRITELLHKFSTRIDLMSASQKGSISYALQAAIAYKTMSFGLMQFAPMLGPVGIGLASLGTAALVNKHGFLGLTDSMSPLGKLLTEFGNLFSAILTVVKPVAEVLAEAMIPAVKMLASVVRFVSSLINENTLKWIAAAVAFKIAISVIMMMVAAYKALIASQILSLAFGGVAGMAMLTAGAVAAAVALNMVSGAIDGVSTSVESLDRRLAKLAGKIASTTDEIEEMKEKIAGDSFLDKALAPGRMRYQEYLEGELAELKAKERGLKQKKEDGAKGKKGDNRGAEMQRLGGPEAVEATWMRIAASSRMIGAGGGKTDAEKQLEAQEKANKKLDRIGDGVERIKPAVV